MTAQLSLFDHTPGEGDDLLDLSQEIVSLSLDKDHSNERLSDLIPNGALLELVRSYETRAVHVSRILNLLEGNRASGQVLLRDEISQQLSMTNALGESTISVMRRMALIDPQYNITALGRLVVTNSPYLDDPGLLWLLHYLLASDAQLILWANLFDSVLLERDEITVPGAAEVFRPLAGRWSDYSISKKIPKELRAIFRTYDQALFSALRLIREDTPGSYVVFRETEPIPLLIWLSILLVYRDRYYPGATSLEVPLIARAHYSPGRVLRRNEATVRQALDELHSAGLLTVETRLGLDQVRFKREYTWLSAVAQHLRGEERP